MVEVNRVRSKPFILSRSIHQGCPFSTLLYVLELEPFLCRLRENPVLGRISLRGAIHVIQVHRLHSAEIEVGKEIRMYETVIGTKIKRDKAVGLWLGLWTDGSCKIIVVWFSPNLQLEENWSDVMVKVVVMVNLWLPRNFSLKLGPRCELRTSTPLSVTVFQFCHFCPLSWIRGRWLAFTVVTELLWCVTRIGASISLRATLEYWTLWPVGTRSVCNNLVGYVHRTTWTTASKGKMTKKFSRFWGACPRRGGYRFCSEECYFYREWRHALRVFFFLDTDWPLWYAAVFERDITSDVSSIHDNLIEVLGFCAWDEMHHSPRLMIRNALWISKKSFTTWLVISP